MLPIIPKDQTGVVEGCACWCGNLPASTYMPWLLRVFRDRFPDVELVLHEGDTWTQFKDLLDGRLNVGIVRGPVNVAGLVATSVLTEPLIIALPKDHSQARRRVALASLANEAFVMVPRRVGALYEECMRVCHEDGFAPKVSQEAIQLHIVAAW